MWTFENSDPFPTMKYGWTERYAHVTSELSPTEPAVLSEEAAQ